MFVARRIAVRGARELQRHHRPALRRRAEYGRDGRGAPRAAPTPTTTSIPASRSKAWPRPATRGSGSSIALTTRAMPAATIAWRAGRGPALMETRLQRHIKRRARRRRPGLVDRVALGMRAPARRRCAAPDEDSVANDQRADRRIGRAERRDCAARTQRRRHEALVLDGAASMQLEPHAHRGSASDFLGLTRDFRAALQARPQVRRRSH